MRPDIPIIYATNDRVAEALQVAHGKKGRVCNPKYYDGVETYLRDGKTRVVAEVSIFAGSPHLDSIVEDYANHRVDVKVLDGGGAATTAPPAAPAAAPAAPPAEAASEDTSAADLPPWSGKFTPAEYLERWGNSKTPKAELARRYVEAGRGEG